MKLRRPNAQHQVLALERDGSDVLPAHGFTPAVSNTQTCRVNIETARTGTAGTPEDFRIERFNGVGPCANF